MKDIELVCEAIRKEAREGAEFYPIDRMTVLKFLPQILHLDVSDFLAYNLNVFSELYVTQLMTCIPEIWLKMTPASLENLFGRINEVSGFFTLIRFAHRYLEIDLTMALLSSEAISKATKIEALRELLYWVQTLFKDKDDLEELEEEHFGVNNAQLTDVRKRVLEQGWFFSGSLSVQEHCAKLESILDTLHEQG